MGVSVDAASRWTSVGGDCRRGTVGGMSSASGWDSWTGTDSWAGAWAGSWVGSWGSVAERTGATGAAPATSTSLEVSSGMTSLDMSLSAAGACSSIGSWVTGETACAWSVSDCSTRARLPFFLHRKNLGMVTLPSFLALLAPVSVCVKKKIYTKLIGNELLSCFSNSLNSASR